MPKSDQHFNSGPARGVWYFYIFEASCAGPPGVMTMANFHTEGVFSTQTTVSTILGEVEANGTNCGCCIFTAVVEMCFRRYRIHPCIRCSRSFCPKIEHQKLVLRLTQGDKITHFNAT